MCKKQLIGDSSVYGICTNTYNYDKNIPSSVTNLTVIRRTFIGIHYSMGGMRVCGLSTHTYIYIYRYITMIEKSWV